LPQRFKSRLDNVRRLGWPVQPDLDPAKRGLTLTPQTLVFLALAGVILAVALTLKKPFHEAVLEVAAGISVLLAVTFLLSSELHRELAEQERRVALNGLVITSTGSAVSTATIQVINVGTGEVTNAWTHSDGTYVIANLKPGTYLVRVTADGFRPLEQVDKFDKDTSLQLQLSRSSKN
jgi:hypothetical protein